MNQMYPKQYLPYLLYYTINARGDIETDISLDIQTYDLLQAILLLQNVCVRIMRGRVLSLSHITSPIVVIICRHANHTCESV